MASRLTPTRKILYLAGPTGAGKTTVMAQFVSANPSYSVSYFVGGDLWSASAPRFLFDLSQQMLAALDRTPMKSAPDYDRLRQNFSTLLSQFFTKARSSPQPYFFVVDALDQALREHDDSIVSLLPTSLPRNVYLVTSGALNSRAAPDIGATAEEIPRLSLPETQYLLERSQLTDDEARRVHEASGGLPGYVVEITRRIDEGADKADLLSDLPSGLFPLFEQDWAALAPDQGARTIVATLAFAPERLGLVDLAEILGDGRDEVETRAAGLPFLVRRAGDIVEFASDAHRQYYRDRLQAERADAESRLIGHYEGDPESERSLLFLPALLRDSQNFAKLKSLMTGDYIVRALDRTRDMSLTRDALRVATRAAADSEDTGSLVSYGLTSSFLTSALAQGESLENEIGAWCAVGEYDKALELADASLFPHDRLKALGTVALGMASAGLTIPPEIEDAVDQLVEQVTPSFSAEEAAEIAAHFYPVRPDAALRFLDRCLGESSGRALDRALTALSIRTAHHGRDVIGAAQSRIGDPVLRDWVGAHVPGAARLDPDAVIARAAAVEDISGRLFLLRTWCNQNRANAQAARVIGRALEWITESSDYTVSARVLRQLAEPLSAVAVEQARPLIERMTLLREALPQKPFGEWVRLEMIIASQEWRWSFVAGAERVMQLLLTLEHVDDVDRRAYACAQALLTLRRVDPEDSAGLQGDVNAALLDAFGRVVADTAEQGELSYRTIHAATLCDLELGIRLAQSLNTQERRDRACARVVQAYGSSQTGNDVFATEDAIRVLEAIWQGDSIRGRATVDLTSDVRRLGRPFAEEALDQLSEALRQIPDPADRAEGFANLAAWATGAGAGDQAREAADLSRQEWLMVDIGWERQTTAYRIVGILGPALKEFATALINESEALSSRSLGDNPFFGHALAHTVATAASGLPLPGGTELVPAWMEGAIESSSGLTLIDFLSRCAARLYAANHDAEAGEIVRRVMAAIDAIEPEYSRWRAVGISAAVLAAYDKEEFLERVATLPIYVRDDVIRLAIRFMVARIPPDVHWSQESPINVDLPFPRVRAACDLIAALTTDNSVYWTAQLLVDCLVEARRQLPGKQLMEVAGRLQEIARARLPDPLNIQHDGYVIGMRIEGLRLMLHASQGKNKPNVAELRAAIDGIPNRADRAVMRAWAATSLTRWDPKGAAALLSGLDSTIAAIPDSLDRTHRRLAMVEAYRKLGDVERAKELLSMAFADARDIDDPDGGERLLDMVLEEADEIDPELASGLTAQIDDVVRRHSQDERRAERELRRTPTRIRQQAEADPDALPSRLGPSARLLVGTLANGRGVLQPRGVAREWLERAAGAEYAGALAVAEWATELAKRSNWRDEHLQIEDGLSQVARAIQGVGAIYLGRRVIAADAAIRTVPSNLQLFHVGDREKAFEEIGNWIKENVGPWLAIVDPYFSIRDLDVLRAVPATASVRIFTSVEAQRGLRGDASPLLKALAETYGVAWRERVDMAPPATQITVMGDAKMGKSPLHDRYLLAEAGGLRLGSSLGGLGSRESEATAMTPEEVQEVLATSIGPWLAIPTPNFNGEELRVYAFPLA